MMRIEKKKLIYEDKWLVFKKSNALAFQENKLKS